MTFQNLLFLSLLIETRHLTFETQFQDPILNATVHEHPNAITKAYVRTVARLGPIVEVRAAQGTQDLPIFLRFIDKDSRWTFNNGLPTLITTLLNFNLAGYSFVLPDMVGGNGYIELPTEELFIRWLQINVFIPSIQFSYVPWDFSDKVIEISKKFTALHSQYTPEIIKALENNVATGEPANPPIWFLDPFDKTAFAINDGLYRIELIYLFVC